MDLRTKLVFAFVAATLLGMLAVGALAYESAKSTIVERAEANLMTVAAARAEQAESAVRRWEELVALVAGDARLARLLGSPVGARDGASLRDVDQALTGAVARSRIVDGLTVVDSEGRVVAAAGSDLDRLAAHTTDTPDPHLVGYTADEPPRAVYAAAVTLDGRPVGSVVASLSTAGLADVASGLIGLGETGETLVGTVDETGARLLAPRRLRPADDSLGFSESTEELIGRALAGERGPITSDIVDFRGEPVWAALRRIPRADLGLVVKFDASEQTADIEALADRLRGVGLSLAAFAILFGVFLGFRFARPINALAGVASQLRDGDLTSRAEFDRRDEIGLLAETFNEMADELEQRMERLQNYKTFFDEAKDLLCIAGTDGYFQLVNPAFIETLGYSEEELLGQPFVEFVHPDDRAATIRETERLQDGHPTVLFTNRYLCKDGTYLHLHWRAHPDPERGLIYASARTGSDLLS